VAVTDVPVKAAFLKAADDWRQGVRAAVRLLVDLGTADETYIDACVRSVEKHGPYIVLTPGVALAHAQAAEGTTTEGLAALRLDAPVRFGHPSNDPVDLVLAFSSGGSHMGMIRAMGRALTGGLADRLRHARDVGHAELTLAEAVNE
jgi:ascorbate PTS system EIIA or EIIAB component